MAKDLQISQNDLNLFRNDSRGLKAAPMEYTHIAIDTSNVYQIDIDCPQYSEDIKNFLNEYPFTRSSTKAYGRHIFVKDPDFEPRCKRLQFKKTLGNAVELLCGQWAWCPKNEYVNNSNAAFYYSGLDTLIAPGKESVNKTNLVRVAHGKEGDLNSEIHKDIKKYLESLKLECLKGCRFGTIRYDDQYTKYIVSLQAPTNYCPAKKGGAIILLIVHRLKSASAIVS